MLDTVGKRLLGEAVLLAQRNESFGECHLGWEGYGWCPAHQIKYAIRRQQTYVLTGVGWESAMARVAEREVERLKEEVSLQRLVEAAGVELRAPGQRPRRALPVSRGPQPVAGGLAGRRTCGIAWGRARRAGR